MISERLFKERRPQETTSRIAPTPKTQRTTTTPVSVLKASNVTRTLACKSATRGQKRQESKYYTYESVPVSETESTQNRDQSIRSQAKVGAPTEKTLKFRTPSKVSGVEEPVKAALEVSDVACFEYHDEDAVASLDLYNEIMLCLRHTRRNNMILCVMLLVVISAYLFVCE